MPQLELAIWSAMSGVLLFLMLVSVGDFAAQRTLSAARGALFMLVTGGACVLQSSLPEVLLPGLDPEWLSPAKAAMGPLSGALALNYLGIWAGVIGEDELVRWTVAIGSFGLLAAAVILAGLAVVGPWTAAQVLLVSAAVNAVSVVLAGMVAVRSAILGDSLARWMALACVCLAGMVAGLYAKGLQLDVGGSGTWAATAACTVSYFMIVIALTIQRNREQRRLRRLASNVLDEGSGGGLHKGAGLVRQVDDALWRSQRLRRPCSLAAVFIQNLHEPARDLGPAADAALLAVLAARIRRLVGFRNVVGLYHPRCFVLAVSAVQDRKRSQLLAEQLLASLRKPILLRGHDLGDGVRFHPVVGMALVEVDGPCDNPVAAINVAEQAAVNAAANASGLVVAPWPPVGSPAAA